MSAAQCGRYHVGADRQRRLLAARRWVPVAPRVHLVLPSAVERDDWPERLAQRGMVAALYGGPRTFATGLAALSLLGVQGAPLNYRPEVATLVTRLRSVPEVHVRRLRGDGTGGPRQRLVVTLPACTVMDTVNALLDAVPGSDVATVTCLLDSALHSGRLTPLDLDRIAAALVGRPGAATFRAARPRCDGRSESPFETLARLQCEDHGVAPDDLQRDVYTREGRFVGRCDLVWELGGGRLLIVELDGAHHRKKGQIDKDNKRDNELQALGHQVFHFSWRQLQTDEVWRTVVQALIDEGRLRPVLAS